MAAGSVRLPDLTQKITVDTKDLDRAVLAAKRFKSEMDKSLQVGDGNNAGRGLDDLEKRIRNLSKANDDLKRSSDESAKSMRAHAAEADHLATSMSKAEQELQKYSSTAGTLKGDSEGLRKSQQDLGQEFQRTQGEVQRTDEALSKLEAENQRLRQEFEGSQQETARLEQSLAALSNQVTKNSAGQDDYARRTKAAADAVKGAAGDVESARTREAAAEAKLTDVRSKAAAAAQKVEAAEQRLQAAQAKTEPTSAALSKAEQNLAEAKDVVAEASQRVEAAEARVQAVRNAEGSTAADITRAEQSLGAARNFENTATAAAARVEAQYNEARAKSATAAADVASAEARATDARRNHANVTRDAEKAEGDLSKAHADVARATDDAGNRTNIFSRALSTLSGGLGNVSGRLRDHGNALKEMEGGSVAAGDATTVLGRAVGGLGTLFGDASTAAGTLANAAEGLTGILDTVAGGVKDVTGGFSGLLGVAGQIASTIVSMGVQFSAFAAIAGAVTAAVGAVGAALTGLPALIFGAGAAIATLALGFDNFGAAIKKANTPAELKKQQEALDKLAPSARATAEAINTGLRPAFEGLQRQVQQHLFEGMAAEIDKVTAAAGPLTAGLLGIADELNKFARGIADVVLSSDGLTKVQAALDNTKALIDAMLPGVQNLVAAFLNVASVRPIFDALGGIISDLSNHVADFLNAMVTGSQPGVQAMQNLRDILDTVEGALVQVLTAAVNFFNQSTPGFDNLVTSVSGLASELINDLGGAFNTALQAASDFIQNIPQVDIDNFKQAIKDLATAFLDFANSPAPGMIVDFITRIIQAFSSFVEMIAGVAKAVDNVTYWFAKLDESMGIATQEDRDVITAHDQLAASTDNLATSFRTAGSDLSTGLLDPLKKAPPQAQAAATGIVNGILVPISALPGLTQAQFDQLPPMIQQQLATMSQNGTKGAQQVRDSIKGPMSEIPGIGQQQFNTLSKDVQDGLLRTQNLARPGAEGIVNGIRIPISALPGLTQEQFDKLPKIAQEQLLQTSINANNGAQKIPDNLQGPMSKVPGIAERVFEQLSKTTQDELLKVAGVAQDGGQKIATGATDPVKDVPIKFGDCFKPVAGIVQANMGDAASKAQVGAGQVASSLYGGVKPIPDQVGSIFNQVPGKITDPLSKAPDAAGKAVAPTGPAVADNLKPAADAGKAGGDAIVKGITDALGPLGPAVKTAMDGAVKETTDGIAAITKAATIPPIRVTVQADTSQADQQVRAFADSVPRMPGAILTVTANFDQFNVQLANRLADIARAPVPVPLSTNFDLFFTPQFVAKYQQIVNGAPWPIPMSINWDTYFTPMFLQKYNEIVHGAPWPIPFTGDFTQLINLYTQLVQMLESTPIIIPIYGQFMGILGLGGGGGGGGGGGLAAANGGVFEYFANGGMSQRDRNAMKAMLGGAVSFNAPGNLKSSALWSSMGLTPMAADKAQVVAPNTWRVIGDRAQGDEAFIPINNSPRSEALLQETASRMGFVMSKVQRMAQGGFGNAQTTTTGGPVSDGSYVTSTSHTQQDAPLINGDLNIVVPQDTPVQDAMDEAVFQLRRIKRGGVYSANRSRGIG